MELKDIVRQRRAFRALKPVAITDPMIRDLVEVAGLAPSCFNNQPWRYVFAVDPQVLKQLHGALSKGNAWMQAASMIIGVVSRKEMDCMVKEREYFLFDTGMATAFLILRATEMGLVAHPIAGFDEDRAKEVLQIPKEFELITLVAVGQHADQPTHLMNEKQIEIEKKRPERLALSEIMKVDHF